MLQTYISLAGLVLALVGLPLVFLQLQDLKRSVRTGAHAALYSQGADFRAHLVQFPHLRRYFFEGAPIGPEHEEYDRVLVIADLLLNHLEHIVVLGDSFGTQNRPALERFCRFSLERSPVLRQHLQANRAAYSDRLHNLLPREPAGSA